MKMFKLVNNESRSYGVHRNSETEVPTTNPRAIVDKRPISEGRKAIEDYNNGVIFRKDNKSGLPIQLKSETKITSGKSEHRPGCCCGSCVTNKPTPTADLNHNSQIIQLQRCYICGVEDGHEEQCPENDEEEARPANNRRVPAINFLPREDEMTAFNHLVDIGDQAYHEVGYYAPETISYSSGMQQITANSRERESNEQGIGLRNLAQQHPFNMEAPNSRARDIVEESEMEIPSQMWEPRQIQSLHGIARSLGDYNSGRNPLNYAAGSQSANLSMQGFEDPLGESGIREHFSMETTFYSDPRAPIAHGISTQIQHNRSNVPSLIINQSGFNTSSTYEGVRRQQDFVRAYLEHVAQNPPLAPPTPEEVYRFFSDQNLSEQECIAISSMIMSSQTAVLGDNPWQMNSTPIDAQEDVQSMDMSQDGVEDMPHPGFIYPPVAALNAGGMINHYFNVIGWANNQGTYSREFHYVRDEPNNAIHLLIQAGMDVNEAQYFVHQLNMYIDNLNLREGYVQPEDQEQILNQLGPGEQLLAIIRYLWSIE